MHLLTGTVSIPDRTKKMPLRDTLKRLGERASETSLNRTEIIDEWSRAIVRFYDQIREYLKEYLDDGSISLRSITFVSVYEESLGQYPISMMTLAAGPAIIEVKPVGRMIVGATGRVDLYRQGRASPNERVMALRTSHPRDASDEWKLNIPPKDRSFELMNMSDLVASQKPEIKPFDKTNLELAIDRLLQ
jgi:hypothetical protein